MLGITKWKKYSNFCKFHLTQENIGNGLTGSIKGRRNTDGGKHWVKKT